MFNNYKIINNVLYLYVDDKCEIGSLFNDSKNSSIVDKIRSYIRDNKIKFDGTKVILLLSGFRISRIKFNDKEYSGVEIRNLLGLRSADFDCNIMGDGVIFTTRGYGHGVGMSQYGANGMASVGYSFDKILNHYYTGVQIVKNY